MLFIFPSRYLFAIGLSPLFSLGWNLPPNWSCIPKQLDSWRADRIRAGRSSADDGVCTLCDVATIRLERGPARVMLLQVTIRLSILKGDYKVELFPLRSPLIGESTLVSFPPLIDMLKFSG